MDLREIELTDFVATARHPWELARVEVIAGLIQTYAKDLTTKTINILDMGCGDTYLIEALSEKLDQARFQAVDIAFSPTLIEQYRQRFAANDIPIDVFSSMEERNKTCGDETIDLVLLLDVIEHIESDISFLEELQQNKGIGPHTRFLITVPAYQRLFGTHDEFLGHYRRYNNQKLNKHIEAAGMKTLHIGYFFMSLLLARFFRVLKEKIAKPKEVVGIGKWAGSRYKTQILKHILLIDYHIGKWVRAGGISLPGLSNFVICTPVATR